MPGSDSDVPVLPDWSDRPRWLDRPLDYGPPFDEVGLPVELFRSTRKEAERVPLARSALARGLILAERGPPGSP